jgi:hypothetical protein
MLSFLILIGLISLSLSLSYSINAKNRIIFNNNHLISNRNDITRLKVSADFATEIVESTVTDDIYGPIFKAGLFLFLSGIVSTIIAASIVSKSNTWESLNEEFEKGKENQLMQMSEASIKEEGKIETLVNQSNEQEKKDIKDLDL